MGRRVFSREFKVEAVRLVVERGVTYRQAAKDLGIHENLLRKWAKDLRSDPGQAFPGRGKMKPDDAEVARLRRELAKTKTERDILKNAQVEFESAARRPATGREHRPHARWPRRFEGPGDQVTRVRPQQ